VRLLVDPGYSIHDIRISRDTDLVVGSLYAVRFAVGPGR
jgi:hypothetical protein